MRIGLLHGYELTGSGSNEYTRYLSRALARHGHEVHVLCRESEPAALPHVSRAIRWDADGASHELFARDTDGVCVVHQLPHASVRPVFLQDKQRAGPVKAFTELTDAELDEYHALNVTVVRAVLAAHPVDLLHANHLVWQPCIAAETAVPFVVYPHGSSIEYTVKADARYRERAGAALDLAAGLICGNREVHDRILTLYPTRRDALRRKSGIVGVGVDTSLFAPVEVGARRAKVARLDGIYTGKSRALQEELLAQLARNEWHAVADYRDAYDHGVPDADLPEKLARIPWEERRVCLFVGALTAGKGVQSLIAAFAELLPAHLVIVGSGAYREVLEALVDAIARGDQELFDHLGRRGFDLDRSDLTGGWADVGGPVPTCPDLPRHVHFLGRLNHEQLACVFPCADLAVFPSVIPEAYPLVLMEALSNGVLPVVSDFSGFKDGLDGLAPALGRDLVDRMRLPLEPAGRVAAIATRLRTLLDDRSWDAGALRRLATDEFDWSVRAEQMTAAYRRFA